jgi:OHCU decarboxylase
MTSLEALNRAAPAEFVARLAGIFEHSPWVPERVVAARPFASIATLHGAMAAAVANAGEVAQLRLICAHPDLAGRAALRGDLTRESSREQQGAGLSACTPLELERLQALNVEYRRRFEFPFILAVKGHNPASIIAALETRLANDRDTELRTALEQIGLIARFRLEALVAEESAAVAATSSRIATAQAGSPAPPTSLANPALR